MISIIQHHFKATFRLGFFTKLTAWVLIMGWGINVSQLHAQGTIPLQKGMAVLSCFSGIAPNNSDNGAQQNPNGPVLAVFDIRNPQGNGAPFGPSGYWTTPTTGAYHPANWSAANMGELFGVALEEGATNPAIFASTTGITASVNMNLVPKTGGTGGEVFRVNGTTGAVTTLAVLPNTTYSFGGFTRYVGLGDITYNRTHNVVYVSNLDNGLVYAINATTGAILGTPFNHNTALADDTNLPFTQLERRVFGVVYRVEDNKLYYAVKAPGMNAINPGEPLLNANQIYTVNINSDGSIDAASKSAAPVISFSPTNAGFGCMVSDMALSSDGSQMLIAEMNLENQTNGAVTVIHKTAHNSNVYKYGYSGGAWAQSLSYVQQVGSFGPIRGNSAGGVDFGFNNYGATGSGMDLDDAAVITADQVSTGGGQGFGFQITNIVAPNTYATSYLIDLDGATGINDNDKFSSGDIEVFGETCTPPSFTLTQTAPGCSTGSISNNNGKITLTTFSNANRYGVSLGATYTGPAYASATALPAIVFPLNVQTGIPNTGGTYTIRLFNQNDACYIDQTVVVAPIVCTCSAITYPICAGESYTLTAAPGLTNIQWQINIGAGFVNIPGANSNTYMATLAGTYMYTATDPSQGSCPGSSCCPVTIIALPVISNPSGPQTLCVGDAGSAITAIASQNTANSIRFVRFNSDQTANNAAPTPAELSAIYGGGTVLATVTPAGAAAPYIATLSTAAANWSALAAGTYYVYVILNPDPGAACQQVQEVIVTISPQANAGTDGSTAVCDNSATAIDLFSLITGEQAGGAWTRLSGTGGTFNNGSGTFTPSLGATTSTFLYTVTGASPCPNDQAVATVNITSQPNLVVSNGSICANSSIDLALLVTNAGGGTLSFYTTLADAQAGTNPLASSNVSPTGSKTYYVRSEATATCFATGEITVSIASSPGLIVTTGSVCSGGSIDLNTLVTNAGGGSLTFHNTYANAVAGNPIISSIVSPSAATNYYVRSTFSSGCFGVREITVSLKLVACGVITLTGPTN